MSVPFYVGRVAVLTLPESLDSHSISTKWVVKDIIDFDSSLDSNIHLEALLGAYVPLNKITNSQNIKINSIVRRSFDVHTKTESWEAL